MLDLAVPRDFDPRIGQRPGVWLYSVDDLAAACAANRKSRQRDLPAALPSLWTRHGASPPADLLRGGRLRTEEEAEFDELRAREAACGEGETAEQVRNALSGKKKKNTSGRRSSSGGGAEEEGGGGSAKKQVESPVLSPA